MIASCRLIDRVIDLFVFTVFSEGEHRFTYKAVECLKYVHVAD